MPFDIAAGWAEDDAIREAARPANDHYTGEPCAVCGRVRVYLRRDGKTQCEKCETVFPANVTPQPAMTAEQWDAALRDREGFAEAMQRAWGNETTRENEHALAALCLCQQPFGFTANDVRILRWLATMELVWECDSLADRIAALLPPE